MSILLIVELPLFSLKFKHFKWKGNEIRYVFLITCGLLIPFLLVWSIPLIVFLQIILSVINTQVTKNKENEIQS
jgi:CDP-diacylglycerol--serine O-phosphatidyltransferase